MDGALISAPEQGEGGNSNVYYEPLVEGVQEIKVQNNSFSAEFGNNGGTVVNMVHEERDQRLPWHGWYFLQRPQMDARDFFNPKYPLGEYRRSIPSRTARATRVDFRSAGRSGRIKLSFLLTSRK